MSALGRKQTFDECLQGQHQPGPVDVIGLEGAQRHRAGREAVVDARADDLDGRAGGQQRAHPPGRDRSPSDDQHAPAREVQVQRERGQEPATMPAPRVVPVVSSTTMNAPVVRSSA